MSNLSKREDSEGPLTLVGTVNTPGIYLYGDEASLYSIAEDSREGRQSDINSRASDINSRASDINSRASEVPGRIPSRIKAHGVGASSSAVEVRWVAHDGGKEILDSDDGYEDDYYPAGMAGHNSRRLRMCAAASIIFILIMAVTLGVTLSKDNEPSRSSTGSGVAGLDEVASVPTPAVPTPASPSAFPSVAPTTASPSAGPSPTPTISSSPSTEPEPTSSPTSTSQLLAAFYLKGILSSCTQEYILLDETTLQGQVFQQLLEEEIAAATVDGGGQIFFDIERGPDFIMERYALMMLFLSTNGQDWQNANGWMDPDLDVCSWFGVLNCSQRNEGSCAVININLNSNNLVGDIPQEFCCLPCVANIKLSANTFSDAPQCLGEIPTLQLLEMDLFN